MAFAFEIGAGTHSGHVHPAVDEMKSQRETAVDCCNVLGFPTFVELGSVKADNNVKGIPLRGSRKGDLCRVRDMAKTHTGRTT